MRVFEPLLFDLDGTLIDSLSDLASAVNRLRRAHGLPDLETAVIERFVGDGSTLLVKRSLPAERFNPGQVEAFLAYYRQGLVDRTRPYPGITACLAACGDRSMAVVTNKPVALAREILDRLALLKYFPVVVGGDSCDARKPDPEPVRLALAELGHSAAAALMIGDHRNDLLAGRGAGIRTCFCAWGFGHHGGPDWDFTAARPAHLARLLTGRP